MSERTVCDFQRGTGWRASKSYQYSYSIGWRENFNNAYPVFSHLDTVHECGGSIRRTTRVNPLHCNIVARKYYSCIKQLVLFYEVSVWVLCMIELIDAL